MKAINKFMKTFISTEDYNVTSYFILLIFLPLIPNVQNI
jgi:hypothetical protein